MGIRTRRARKNSRTHIVGFGLAGMLGFVALLIIAVSVSLGALVSSWLEDLPDYGSADAYVVAEPTRVFDADGNEIVDYYLQQRRSVDMSQISEYVIKGTVDTEDIRFYQHNGVDPQGIARAAVGALFGGSEGGSTITQQLVRNTILSDEQFEFSIRRKVREAYIAIQMEKQYTKEQILNMYLNTIYYGNGAYGIEAASIIYFNKHANELSLAEAATLIGLPASPSYLDATINPEGAKSRRDLVLDRMLSAGDITQEEHDAAQAEELVLNPGQLTNPVGTYPYFTDYVKKLLLEDFSSDTILQGGLKVYTTIDPDYQAAAEQACNQRLEELGNDELGAALVSIDPSTGYIKAMVGGQDYSVSQYNLATTTNRQMGSSFKTFALIAAIDSGMNPEIILNCTSPMQVTPTWKVQNYGNHDYGIRSLASATWISSNTAYAQVAEAIGVDKIISTCRALGITSDLSPYLSITLGAEGVSAVEQCAAYAVLPADGQYRRPVAITRIEDRNGNVIYEHKDEPTQALSPEVAEATTDVLRGVITSGTGTTAYGLSTFDQPIAGKTGTSDEAEDLWFCAYTPQLCTVVWCGYPNSREPTFIFGSYGSTQVSTQYIWAYYMNQVLAGVDRAEFPDCGRTPDYKPNSSWTFVGTSQATNDEQVVETVDEDVTETTTTTTTGDGTQTPGTTTSTTTTTNPDGSTTTTTTETTTTVTPGTGGGTGGGGGGGDTGGGTGGDGAGGGDTGGGA